MDQVIGLDFDNTLITYDDVLHKLALERDLIGSETPKSKKTIRDCVRRQPDGEIQWQKLQALAYGSSIKEARLSAGVTDFFRICRLHQLKVFVVSHKTEFSNYDQTGTNLRHAAFEWMAANGFFGPVGLGLSMNDIFFETTRQNKVERIRELRCTHFVDDLEETFAEPSFPQGVGKILYNPHNESSCVPGLTVVRSWYNISEYLFRARC